MSYSKHQIWISSLYSQYDNQQLHKHCEINLDEIEIKYRNIESEQTFASYNFEEEWLKYYPPLLKRQYGFTQ